MSPSRSRYRALLALGVVGVVGVLFVSASGRDDREQAQEKTNAPAIAPRTRRVVARAADDLAARRLRVEAIVAKNNAALQVQRRALAADGWTLVDVAAPDPALTAASPELLPAREADLRAQLLSAPPGAERLENVAAIATRARDDETRVAAVEALARMGPGDPQRSLLDVMRQLDPADPARRRLVALFHPGSMADPIARDLIALLEVPSVTGDEKEQIAMTVSLVALREGDALPSELTDEMSSSARALIDHMMLLAQRAPTVGRIER